jgi:phage shock protein PspC (stress-responsive transcriptional regulator)
MIEENEKKDPGEDDFFSRIENSSPYIRTRQLKRSGSNFMVAGVCSGIADYWKVDPAYLRLVAILSLLIGFYSVVVYFLLAVLMPAEVEQQEISVDKTRAERERNFIVLLSGLFILLGVSSAFRKFGLLQVDSIGLFPRSILTLLFCIVIGFYFILRKKGTILPETAPRSVFKRLRDDRAVLGVCGGLAKYLGTGPALVRIVFVFASLVTFGLFAIVYLLLSFFSQLEPESINDF